MFDTLDFSLFVSEGTDASTRQSFCKKIVESFSQQGFVKLKNHGISMQAVDDAFAYSKRFFDLPMEVKMRAPHPAGTNPHRGFSPVGLEKVAPAYGTNGYIAQTKAKAMDIKESYDVGSDQNSLHPNIWLSDDDLPNFRASIQAYFNECFETQQQVLIALAQGLSIPLDTFTKLHQQHQSELRLTHYPSTARSALEDKLRIVQHTDFGSITLLFQDSVGGLQAKDTRTGEYCPVETSDRYEMIVNIGDCMQLWTAGKLKSVLHRVNVPESEICNSQDAIPRRFSVAFFAKPDRDVVLRPVNDAWSEKEDENERFMTAGEFQEARIRGTYS